MSNTMNRNSSLDARAIRELGEGGSPVQSGPSEEQSASGQGRYSTVIGARGA